MMKSIIRELTRDRSVCPGAWKGSLKACHLITPCLIMRKGHILQLIPHLKAACGSGSVCSMGSLMTQADISHSCGSFANAMREMQSLVSPVGDL